MTPRAGPTPGDLTVEIGTLRLTGFSRADARRVEDGFRLELSRLTAADLATGARRTDRIETETDGRGTPERIGAEAARALIAELGE
jgi:hypothetical protein